MVFAVCGWHETWFGDRILSSAGAVECLKRGQGPPVDVAPKYEAALDVSQGLKKVTPVP